MMDHFLEEVVTKHNKTLPSILYVFASIMMVVFGLIGVFFLSRIMAMLSGGEFNWVVLVLFVLCGGMAVLLYLYKDRLKLEYEYSFTNGDLDFAEIYNNNKRKSLGTMKVANVEAFGPVDSENFRKLVNMPGLKVRNWFLNRGANLYYFYYQKAEAKNMIVLEPSEDMVSIIRKYLPRGAWRE